MMVGFCTAWGADLGMTGPECDNDMDHHHARVSSRGDQLRLGKLGIKNCVLGLGVLEEVLWKKLGMRAQIRTRVRMRRGWVRTRSSGPDKASIRCNQLQRGSGVLTEGADGSIEPAVLQPGKRRLRR
jgi:hypothetical protein